MNQQASLSIPSDNCQIHPPCCQGAVSLASYAEIKAQEQEGEGHDMNP